MLREGRTRLPGSSRPVKNERVNRENKSVPFALWSPLPFANENFYSDVEEPLFFSMIALSS